VPLRRGGSRGGKITKSQENSPAGEKQGVEGEKRKRHGGNWIGRPTVTGAGFSWQRGSAEDTEKKQGGWPETNKAGTNSDDGKIAELRVQRKTNLSRRESPGGG